MPKQLLAALVSLMLTACGNPVAPAGEDLSGSTADAIYDGTRVEVRKVRQPRPPAAPVWTSQISDTPTDAIFKTNFAIATTHELYFAFDVPVPATYQQVARFVVSSPNGATFQTTQVPFSTGTSSKYRVWSSMPVAGTWIEQFQIQGMWTLKVYISDEDAPRAQQTFLLQ